MPDKPNNKFADTSAKKAAVTSKKKSTKLPLIAAVVAFALIAGGGIYVMSSGPDKGVQISTASSTSSSGGAAAQAAESTTISLPVDTFDDGKAHYYQHHAANDITVRFFVLKSSDGIIRAAFDACDVCWPAGKGYAQDGDVMICRNCGRRFASIKINEVKGGCNPAPLNRQIKDGMLIIEKSDILEGSRYFDFSNAKADRPARIRG